MSQSLWSRSLAVATIVLLAILASGRPSPAQDSTSTDAPWEEAAASERLANDYRRVPVPSWSAKTNHPFSIDVPLHWEARRDLPAPGVLLGPPGGDPNSHPQMVLVHESAVALDAPEATLANLRANAEGADWSLREGKVIAFGGIRGLWIVRDMPPEGFHGERVSYAVKLPLEDGSLDLLVTVPVRESEALAPRIEHMLRSVRPAGTEVEPARADGPED